MALFSDHQGLSQKPEQIDSLDEDLRNGLWNAVYGAYSIDIYEDKSAKVPSSYGLVPWNYNAKHHNPDGDLIAFSMKLRINVMKVPLKNLNPHKIQLNREGLLEGIQKWILNHPDWNRVYDLIEFLPNNYPGGEKINARFRVLVNDALERENAGYRFVGDQLARLTAETEMQAIEETLKLEGQFSQVAQHTKQALQHLSNRENPDYRNSIKESISAVEAACRVISGKPKATLGEALDKIGDELAHPAVRLALDKLYGWTNDAEGIRHAMSSDANVGLAEARLMTVLCSALTNYLVVKFSVYNT